MPLKSDTLVKFKMQKWYLCDEDGMKEIQTVYNPVGVKVGQQAA